MSRMIRIIFKSAMLALVISLVGAQPALAYIDPNTGGLLFQLLATAFALLSGIALLFAGRIRASVARFRRSLRGLFNPDGSKEQHVEALPQRTHTQDEDR